MKIIKFFLIFLLLIFSSCSLIWFKEKVEFVKYRDKNNIQRLNIDAMAGNIVISGWGKNSIEIETKKKISYGLKTDLNLLDIKISSNQNILNVTTKIPARINGSIDLTIKVPYPLHHIFVKLEKGNLNIKNYLGNLVINQQSGNMDIGFAGQFLRIKTIKSKINLTINSFQQTDTIINNEMGTSKIYIKNCNFNSFVDIISNAGNIDLYTNQKLNPFIRTYSQTKKPSVNYSVHFDDYLFQDFYYTQSKSNNKPGLLINIKSNNDKIVLNEL